MPSSRQTFFTTADELALSEALKERFPNIRFAVRSKSARKGDLTYIDDIPSGERKEVRIFIPPDGWEPDYYKAEYGEESHGISNFPGEFIYFRPSTKLHMERGPANHDGRPMLDQGAIMVGRAPRMTPAETSFRAKVWRIMSKIATPRLKVLRYWDPDHDWVELTKQKIEWAGMDAVRWAFEDERRVFKNTLYYRPADWLRDVVNERRDPRGA